MAEYVSLQPHRVEQDRDISNPMKQSYWALVSKHGFSWILKLLFQQTGTRQKEQ